MSEEESKLFSLKEAEHLRIQLEPILIEAMESRRKMAALDEQLGALGERIQRSGGMQVSYAEAAKLRIERNQVESAVGSALERIHSTGCLVKDLDVGLLDFPARINNEIVYLCWKLGEDRIRFYHRQDEGFAGRKPLNLGDADFHGSIQ